MKSERLVKSANHTSYIDIADKAVSLISIRLLTVSGQKQNEKEKKSRNKEKRVGRNRRKNGGIMKKYIYIYIYIKTGENM